MLLVLLVLFVNSVATTAAHQQASETPPPAIQQTQGPENIQEWGRLANSRIQRRIPVHRFKDLVTEDVEIMIGFTVAPDGTLLSARIVEGSGIDELDQTILTSVQRIRNFPPFSPDMGDEPRDINQSIRIVD